MLTVDNHCDGPWLYLRMLREKNARAEEVLKLLRMNGGKNNPGRRVYQKKSQTCDTVGRPSSLAINKN